MRKNQIVLGLWSVFFSLTAFGQFYIAPHIQNITQDGATIIWETPEASVASVAYGPAGSLTASASGAQAAKIHRVRLTGLEGGKEYDYRVTAGDAVHEARFITAPAEAREIVFVVIGDSRRWDDTWAKTGMKDHVMQWKPEFFLNMGDLVGRGHEYEQWPEHFERFADISGSYWHVTARGNHEGSQIYDTENDWFAKYHELPGAGEPYASFDWGNTHFTIVSYESTGRREAWAKSGAWLDQHLQGVDKRWIVTVQHYPVYCTGYASVDRSRKEPGQNPAEYAKALDTRNVDLNLSGHTHIYERMFPLRGGQRDDLRGVHYLVNGGDIGGNYAERWTVVGDDKATMAKPTYTVFHAKHDRLEGRTFAWSKEDDAIALIDYFVIWKDEATPQAVLATLPGLSGDALTTAIGELGAMGYGAAAPALLPYLKSDDRAVRHAAAKALRLVGSEEVAEALHDYIDDPDPVVARAAARSLELAMPAGMARQVAKDIRKDSLDPVVREHLVGALQFHGGREVAKRAAISVIEDADAPQNVRQRAAYALGMTAEKRDVRTLVQRFEREADPYVTLTLAYTLGELTGQRVNVKNDGPVARSQPGNRKEFASKWQQQRSGRRS
jgi:hypothetical protein